MKPVPARTALCIVWLLVAATGAWALSNYESTPGSVGQIPQRWPTHTRIAHRKDRSILLMFAHPQCPCTRASVDELNRLLARCQGEVETHVLFIAPRTMPNNWTQSTLWQKAAAIPGVTVQLDVDGEEARRFGAESSGSVVLYDARGQLVFNGGITAARGQAGDSAGANMIVSLVTGHDAGLKHTPVFGCALADKTEALNK